MKETYLTFKKYNDLKLATETGEYLRINGIPYFIENNRHGFDPTFAHNGFQSDIIVKIKGADFIKARDVLAQYYRRHLHKIDTDYYLYDFTDRELTEIISKPDEWGDLDYQLAQVILEDRGITVQPETIAAIQESRRQQLAKPDTIHKDRIFWGYLWAAIGGFFVIYTGYFYALFAGLPAVFLGYDLAWSKKTLPDGTQVFAYQEGERKHGRRIVITGIGSIVIWLGIVLYKMLAL